MSEQTNYINLDTILGEKKETVKDQVIVIQEAITPITPTRIVDWDNILNEVCYKLPKGYPTVVDGVFTEREEIIIINEALVAEGLSALPLPEVDKAKPKVIPEKRFKDSTNSKEGLVMYFASLDPNLLKLAENKIVKESAVQLKLPIGKVTNNTYLDAADVINNIELLNTTKNPFDPEIKKKWSNAITSGKFLQNMYGAKIPANLIDRGAGRFNEIKGRGVELAKREGIQGVDKDKWCPADIFIYGSPESPESALESTQLRVQVEGSTCLNNYFAETFTPPAENRILAVSLKEDVARGGKATSYITVLEKSLHYPEVASLNPDLNTKLAAITQLNAYKNKKQDYGELSDALNNLNKIKKTNKDLIKLKTRATLVLKVAVNGDIHAGKKAKLTKKIPPTGSLSNLDESILAFAKSVYANVFKTYVNKQKTYMSTLKKNEQLKVTSEFETETETIEADENVVNTVEELLKKTNCYIVATDLIDKLGDGIIRKIPKGLQQLAKIHNPFIALAAFGMSQAGYSPTFFKLVGNKEFKPAHIDLFPSDGVIKLKPKTEIKVIDSINFKGVKTVYTVRQVSENKNLSKDYKVKLDFLYSGENFKIEITEIKSAD